MEAGHLRENPANSATTRNTSSNHLTLQKADGPSFSSKQSSHQTKPNNKKLTSTGFEEATDIHPACPNKEQNHLQYSLLRRTQFWVRKTFSKPASLKRASLILTNIHILYYRYFYMWTHVVRTHICLCPCECSQLETSLYTCIYSEVYIYHIISQILLYVNPCCANSHMSAPLRVLTVRTSLYT